MAINTLKYAEIFRQKLDAQFSAAATSQAEGNVSDIGKRADDTRAGFASADKNSESKQQLLTEQKAQLTEASQQWM